MCTLVLENIYYYYHVLWLTCRARESFLKPEEVEVRVLTALEGSIPWVAAMKDMI